MPQDCYHLLTTLPRNLALVILIALAPAQIFAGPTRPAIANLTITNGLTRHLTNVIEVTIPDNVFVDTFRTNWVRRDVTNIVDLFKTNIIQQYRTNLVQQYRTNLVQQYRTNMVSLDLYATNFITAWQTNFKSLTLTNWENLVLLRTNLVNRPITNVVEFTRTNFVTYTVTNTTPVTVMATNYVSEKPTALTAPSPSAQPAPAPSIQPTLEPQAIAANVSASDLARGLEVALNYVGAPKRPGQFPIRLTLLAASGNPLPVLEWRVEEIVGRGLMIGAKTEFSNTLAAGIYRITARVRTDDGKTRNILATIEVKSDSRPLRTPAMASLDR